MSGKAKKVRVVATSRAFASQLRRWHAAMLRTSIPCAQRQQHSFTAPNRYHVVGRPQSEDVFVYAVPEHPTWHIGADVTDDGR